MSDQELVEYVRMAAWIKPSSPDLSEEENKKFSEVWWKFIRTSAKNAPGPLGLGVAHRPEDCKDFS